MMPDRPRFWGKTFMSRSPVHFASALLLATLVLFGTSAPTLAADAIVDRSQATRGGQSEDPPPGQIQYPSSAPIEQPLSRVLVASQDQPPLPTAQPAETDAARVARLQKQVDLQQKQIDVLQRMMGLLEQQVKRPAPAADTEALQAQTEMLRSRAQQAARRDQEIGAAIDDLREHADAQQRYGPQLPAPLKELFLPSQTNETPLSIYGQFLDGFHQFDGRPAHFETPDFAPYFLLQLNEQFLLAASIDINNAGVSVGEAQVNWILGDHITLVGGRYITPIGFFSERINHEWINKLPDPPLMFRQVSPLISTDGVELRGGTYIGGSPVKLEYSFYGGNGFELTAPPASLNDVADLGAITGGPDEVDSRAIGGRLGLWVPEWGLTSGVSAYFNGPYAPGAPDNMKLWQFDAGWHKGNWDLRFEYCQNNQEAETFIGNNIVRTGMYAQVAYRPFDALGRIAQNTELVYRYSNARFCGIDFGKLDLTAFADSPVDAPVNRDQHTVGINYYFYPSMVLKFAYEINVESAGVNLHDNVFLAQFAWAF
jgi:hypothetical protein